MQDDDTQKDQNSNSSTGATFSSAYSPDSTSKNQHDELLSRKIKARISQQQSVEDYARKRLENVFLEIQDRHHQNGLASASPKISQPLESVSSISDGGRLGPNQELSEGHSLSQQDSKEITSEVKTAESYQHRDYPYVDIPSGNNTEPNKGQTSVSTSEQPKSDSESELIKNTNYQNRQVGINSFDARKYHQAWQNYYKTYFGRYYQSYYQNYHNQLAEHHQRLRSQMKLLEEKAKNGTASVEEIDEITRIKQEIIAGVKLKAKKVKSHDHFWPSVVATCVLLFLIFFQYNPIIVGAARQYVKPGDSASIPTIVAPNTDTEISQDPTITIPKIGVQAPVQYDIKGLYDADVQPALENGVVRYNFPGNVFPGQKGNVVLIGHSSNNVFNPGKYNYIFVNLNRLTVDDIVVLNYAGVRYSYKVTATEVVSPQEFKYIDDQTTDSVLTLMTCSPPGTNKSRLFVRARQISPNSDLNKSIDESAQSSISDDDNTQKSNVLPGTAPSVWDRITGLFGN
jgi:LPXTG-site transpeptidase (sortase) family protein